MTAAELHSSNLAREYVLDTCACFTGKCVNEYHLCEIFGGFSSVDGYLIKYDMLKEITDNFDWYADKAKVVLQMQGRDLTEWLEAMLKKVWGDEIALYPLSHLYNRHAVVFINRRPCRVATFESIQNSLTFPWQNSSFPWQFILFF